MRLHFVNFFYEKLPNLTPRLTGHTNTKMILENYARFIKGEHLKISRSFDPFKSRGDIGGDIRGDTDRI